MDAIVKSSMQVGSTNIVFIQARLICANLRQACLKILPSIILMAALSGRVIAT